MDFGKLIDKLKESAAKIEEMLKKAKERIEDKMPEVIKDLEDCKNTYNSLKVLIATTLADTDKFESIDDWANLFSNFDKNWDKFADDINKLWRDKDDEDKKNILEVFARNKFGDKVFEAGSVIKNETPEILSGIAEFRAGLDSFKGSYRDPREAATKINNGVRAIVASTEKVANSANNIYKTIQKMRGIKNPQGSVLLENLGSISQNTYVAGAMNALNIGAHGISSFDDIKKIWEGFQKGDKDATNEAAQDLKDNAKNIYDSIKEQESNLYPSTPLGKTQIKIACLLSYYVYYYCDLYENNNWRLIKKKRLYDPGRIKEYIKKREEKKNPPPESGGIKGTIKKIAESIGKVFSFPFVYGTTVENRIYNRIADVCDITGESSEKAINIILNGDKSEGKTPKDYETPVSPYDFFLHCGFWKYLNDEELKNECERWIVCPRKSDENSKVYYNPEEHEGWISGFAAVLLQRAGTNQYMYVFKGTDFDSVFRDWLGTNILQGLTGLSIQHAVAINKAKHYDQSIGAIGGDLAFAGHSLAGGLASAATVATMSRFGYTFNAAGLNVIGVKLSQLLKGGSRVLLPLKDLKRVFPYRIRGEVLDAFQNVVRWTILPTYARGYGYNAVEFDISENAGKEGRPSRHGINNFLYREVMNSLDTFEETAANQDTVRDNIKIKKIIFNLGGA